MELLIIFIKGILFLSGLSILFLSGLSILFFTIKTFVFMPMFDSCGNIYLTRQAYNKDLNETKNRSKILNPKITKFTLSRIVKRFFVKSNTTVSSFNLN